MEQGCEFLLVFDDGSFSENSTFLLSDWFMHTPKEVLAKNFGGAESDFATIPSHELYIFQSQVPGPLSSDTVTSPAGAVPSAFSHRMLAQEPILYDYYATTRQSKFFERRDANANRLKVDLALLRQGLADRGARTRQAGRQPPGGPPQGWDCCGRDPDL